MSNDGEKPPLELPIQTELPEPPEAVHEQLLEQAISSPKERPVCFFCNDSSFTACTNTNCLKFICKHHISLTSLNLCASCNNEENQRGISACFSCLTKSGQTCYICGRPFCKTHTSKRDRWMCSDCSSDAMPTDSLSVDVEIKPLVDDEGVTHKGKWITEVGGTHIAANYIDNLTDEELAAFAHEYQGKIREAEKLMYSRIMVKDRLDIAITDREKKKTRENRAERLARTVSTRQVIAPPIVAKPTSVEVSAKIAELKTSPEGKKQMLEILKALLDRKK